MKSLETRVRELESLLEGRDIDLHERMTTLEETLTQGIHLHNQSQLDRRIRMIECRVASLEVAKLSGPAPGEQKTERSITPTCGSIVARSEMIAGTVPPGGGGFLPIIRNPLPEPVVGEPCPTCGRKVQKRGLSGAERQRQYRERLKS